MRIRDIKHTIGDIRNGLTVFDKFEPVVGKHCLYGAVAAAERKFAPLQSGYTALKPLIFCYRTIGAVNEICHLRKAVFELIAPLGDEQLFNAFGALP